MRDVFTPDRPEPPELEKHNVRARMFDTAAVRALLAPGLDGVAASRLLLMLPDGRLLAAAATPPAPSEQANADAVAGVSAHVFREYSLALAIMGDAPRFVCAVMDGARLAVLPVSARGEALLAAVADPGVPLAVLRPALEALAARLAGPLRDMLLPQ